MPFLFRLLPLSFKPLLPTPFFLLGADDIPIGLMLLCPAPGKEQRDTRSNQRREQRLFGCRAENEQRAAENLNGYIDDAALPSWWF